MRTDKNASSSAWAVAGFMASTMAVAQPTPGTSTATSAGGLEEIVVTAQKREERLSDVPLSITALSGDDLRAIGAQSSTDVVAQVPNVNVQSPFGEAGSPVFNIRGVATMDFGDSNEPSVSVYADDVYLGTTAGQGMQLFDLARVEVLRGPQGTLYGRNATGGLIHFISNRPSHERELNVGLQLGSYGQRIFDGVVGGGVGPMAGRFSFKYNEDDGWQENAVNGGEFSKMNSYAVRGQLAAQFSEDSEALLIVHHSRLDGNYSGYGFFGTVDPATGEPCSPRQVLASKCANGSGFRDPDPRPTRIYSTARSMTNDAEVTGGSLRLDTGLGAATVTSITGYQEVSRFAEEDAAGAAVTPFPLFVNYTTDNRQFTQELRATGASDHGNWVVGAYYYSDDRFVTNDIPSFDFGVFAELNTKTWAVFGQTTFELRPSLSATLGVRYTQEDRELERLASVTGGKAGTKQGTPFLDVSDDLDASRTTGRLALDWKPTDDLLVYGSVSTGFKSGGWNTILVGSLPEIGPVDPEELTAYEVGSKIGFFDRRMFLNSAVFYYDYESIQAVGSYATEGGAPAAAFINAGDAEVLGGEIELSAQPTPEWAVNLGVGLLDTEIVADPTATFSGRKLDGNRLLLSPTTTLNGLVRYTFPLVLGGSLSLQSDFRWQDEVFFGPDNQPTETQGAYGVVNLRARWTSESHRWSLEVFCENVADERYFAYAADISGINQTMVAVWGRPRTWGVRAGLKL